MCVVLRLPSSSPTVNHHTLSYTGTDRSGSAVHSTADLGNTLYLPVRASTFDTRLFLAITACLTIDFFETALSNGVAEHSY